MLILSRKVNERIKIGDDIEIVIADIKGGIVKVGVVAPKDVRVLRPDAVKQTRGGDDKTTNCEAVENE